MSADGTFETCRPSLKRSGFGGSLEEFGACSELPNWNFGPERLDCFLIPRRQCPPASKPQKIVDLALSPAVILGRERVDASIDADVANKELRALDKVRYLINGSSAETTCGSCHRHAPSLPGQRHPVVHMCITIGDRNGFWLRRLPVGCQS
jgi:hypothetical protein